MSSDRIAFEFISGMGLAPPAFIALAAGLGVSRIGLAPSPIVAPSGAEAWSLRDNPALLRDTLRALADHGVRVSLGEGLLIMPGREIADAAADLDLLAELGAPVANAVVIEPDAARAADQFALLVAMADQRGMATSVEFMPGMPVGTLAQALALAEGTGSARAGVLVDAMHLFASGSTAADLAAADPARILYTQICDAKAPGFYEGYYDDARCNRLAPGEGVLPLADFAAAVPPARTIGLELPMLARAEAGETPASWLTPALATTRALLA